MYQCTQRYQLKRHFLSLPLPLPPLFCSLSQHCYRILCLCNLRSSLKSLYMRAQRTNPAPKAMKAPYKINTNHFHCGKNAWIARLLNIVATPWWFLRRSASALYMPAILHSNCLSILIWVSARLPTWSTCSSFFLYNVNYSTAFFFSLKTIPENV